MSAAIVSRIGLPLSQVSAMASFSRLSSIRSAILFEDRGALGDAGPAPGVLGCMGGIERGLDVLRVGARDLADDLAGDRRDVLEVLAGDRRRHSPPMKLS